ncbi:hypothetical protein PUN28_018611 [Cardiocondyla obscurior]|uniref:Uncharacterized protein n=1 Tax=Cardiocondyla obscurior TaxID=286306 RepID=A0AAW2EK47_9HYME
MKSCRGENENGGAAAREFRSPRRSGWAGLTLQHKEENRRL